MVVREVERAISDHLAWLAYLGRAETTIYQRSRVLARMERAGVDLLNASAKELEVWALGLVGRMQDESRAMETTHARGWFRWLVECGRRSDDAGLRLRRPTVRAGMPRPVDVDLVRRAMMAAPLRQRTMLTLAAGAGLRCGEIAGLRWSDVGHDAANPTLVVTGKGNKQRPVPAGELVMAVLSEMAEHHGGRWVIPRGDGRPGPMAPWRVSQVGALALRSAGVSATMHQLRHTFATQLYAATQDIQMVCNLLGHSSIVTTQRYVGLANNTARVGVGQVDAALRRGVNAAAA